MESLIAPKEWKKIIKMKTSIYKWSGQYWGFIYNGRLYDSNCNYNGWIDDLGHVWNTNGTYKGELIEDNYILRQNNQLEPLPKIPLVNQVPPVPPIPMIHRIGKIPKSGWTDVLDKDKC